MILAAMQPYFLPYLGQFDLLNAVDCWVVHDRAQYIRHGWVNRNRVLHAASGWRYITVPVKKHRHTASIDEIEIAGDAWKSQILGQLEHYRMDAPHYAAVKTFLEERFAAAGPALSRLNVALFRGVAELLDIRTSIRVLSEMGLDLRPGSGPQRTALALCAAVGAGEYVNPPGGAGLYDQTEFAGSGVKLTIQRFENMSYPCGRYRHEPGLSIVDVLMWNAPATVKRYLDERRVAGAP